MNSEFTSRLERIESVLQQHLPSQSNPEWRKLSFGAIDSCISESHLANLIAPCKNLLDLGGKRWRPLLLLLCSALTSAAKKSSAEKICESEKKSYLLTPLVEFAHTASLIHDDIEDNADTRRGKPAAHITYGLDVALNAGSWLIFEATACIQELSLNGDEKAALYELFLLELRRLHLGQAMDIYWHRNPELIPTVDEYTAMVRNKTGTLARLAVKLGVFAGGGTASEIEKTGEIAQDIGTGFQIIDDVINLTTGNPGKKRGDDIVEGKKSLPVLIHLSKKPEDLARLSSLFAEARAHGIDSPAVEEAISLLASSGSIDEAKKRGKEIISEKSEALASFFGTQNSAEAALIKDLFESLMSKA
ncbi:MAG: polyprenyl synthetase family protein [Treponema sp.]|uniref:polyprenyl synthetase family protein n=1 Tax=Treponema sp. TaxID=166 RepID=UPI002600B29D|nr:polyprenyl synthetase family protein [Treponema sp.]MBQ9282010.1 polyprenyl synthetase family protein [Treponema sp.]